MYYNIIHICEHPALAPLPNRCVHRNFATLCFRDDLRTPWSALGNFPGPGTLFPLVCVSPWDAFMLPWLFFSSQFSSLRFFMDMLAHQVYLCI